MYNRYEGNSGRMRRVPDREPPPPPPFSGPPGRPSPGPMPGAHPGPGVFLSGLPELSNLLRALDDSDLLLMLVVYLLYRESRDEEFLYLLAGLFLF